MLIGDTIQGAARRRPDGHLAGALEAAVTAQAMLEARVPRQEVSHRFPL